MRCFSTFQSSTEFQNTSNSVTGRCFFFQNLVEDQVPALVEELNLVVQEEAADITNSSASIAAIVQILNNVANISTAVNVAVAQVGCLSTYSYK